MNTQKDFIWITLRYTIVLFINISFSLFSFQSCSEKPKLESALKFAGNNRGELEKVLVFYSHEESDSLKLKAAHFLINNMDAHFAYKSKTWDDFQVELDSLFKREDCPEELEHGFGDLYNKYASRLNDIIYVSDLETIRADFLISNIEKAFEAWKQPYAQHLNFDDFCEYILPYRAGKEPLCDWRKEFNENFIPSLYTRIPLNKGSVSAIELCDAIKTYPDEILSQLGSDLPDYNAHMLSVMRIGNCRQYSLQAIFSARCLGIPIALDFTPQWATRSMAHEWNALIGKNCKPLNFGIGDTCSLGGHIELIKDRIPPKVYRETFAKQNESLAMICGSEEIPPTLASPCMKDVTSDYYLSADVSIKFDFKAPSRNQFAYLAVFNNQNWIPICWAKINEGEALFKNLHKGILCLPGYYYSQKFIPAAPPIIIDSLGNTISLKPYQEKKQTLILSRKYQIGLVDKYCVEMVGGRFQVSNSPYFTNAVDLFEINEKTEASYQIVPIHITKAYKYFRYLAPPKLAGTISEIEIYELGSEKKLSGKLIGTEQTFLKHAKENAFDGNPLTYFGRYDLQKEVWLGLEFDNPKKIRKIVFLPKNDDNCIRDGELYELFYWNNRWVSLGKQTGSSKTYKLKYENVPTNALFLLRNYSRGKEERIFTYEEGKQVWW